MTKCEHGKTKDNCNHCLMTEIVMANARVKAREESLLDLQGDFASEERWATHYFYKLEAAEKEISELRKIVRCIYSETGVVPPEYEKVLNRCFNEITE